MSRKLAKKTGGSTIGEFVWAKDGDVVEVPDALAAELLASAPNEWDDVTDAKPKRAPQAKNIVAE